MDWVFAHDAFIFARNMFIHYHALLFFLFPKHLFCCVSFFFLSFLSFELWHPKSQFLPKTLITRHGSSSSSSSFPFILGRDRFHDSKSQKDFDENFSDRAIHSQYHVILSDFLDTPLPRAFSSWGYESLCEKPSRCPGMFIQEFYSKIHTIDTFVP